MLLKGNDTLKERTALLPDSITELLELCLRSTYFCFNQKMYEQQEGDATGSPVSVVNLHMEHFEKLAFESLDCGPGSGRDTLTSLAALLGLEQ